MTRKKAALHGFGWGIVGGLALVGLMYYAGALLGLRPLPQLLNEPLLSVMPGFVFTSALPSTRCPICLCRLATRRERPGKDRGSIVFWK